MRPTNCIRKECIYLDKTTYPTEAKVCTYERDVLGLQKVSIKFYKVCPLIEDSI